MERHPTMNSIPLENIGFYTLSDYRVKQLSPKSPLWRAELILSDACNFKCAYCRPLRDDCKGSITLEQAKEIVDFWAKEGIKNIRFSGGEPCVWKGLIELVEYTKVTCKASIKHIAISTNGSAPLSFYSRLIEAGVNDFSISLDACCASMGDKMAGNIPGSWEKVISNIQELSKLTYVTVGIVLTEENTKQAVETIRFAHSLGVTDIRVISSAQSNHELSFIAREIPEEILQEHPILEYRMRNFQAGRSVRGLSRNCVDTEKCYLVLDDMAVAGMKHFPCIIYLREGGAPIGNVGPNMRQERLKWFLKHNSYLDPICSKSCLDVCCHFNDKAEAQLMKGI